MKRFIKWLRLRFWPIIAVVAFFLAFVAISLALFTANEAKELAEKDDQIQCDVIKEGRTGTRAYGIAIVNELARDVSTEEREDYRRRASMVAEKELPIPDC